MAEAAALRLAGAAWAGRLDLPARTAGGEGWGNGLAAGGAAFANSGVVGVSTAAGAAGAGAATTARRDDSPPIQSQGMLVAA
ncbi:MAG: hypothetical protein ACJ798_01620 [Phenylobacterium sp.]